MRIRKGIKTMAKIEPGMEAMLDMYFYETNSLLEQLDEILLRTEQANAFESDDIKEIFRIMHTIKGSSAMMGFENLSVLAHKAEDMFFVIRENPDIITDVSFVYDLVFQVSDSYKAQIEAIQNNVNGEYEQFNFDDLIEKLHNAKEKLSAAPFPLPRRQTQKLPQLLRLKQKRLLPLPRATEKQPYAFSSRKAARWKICARSC